MKKTVKHSINELVVNGIITPAGNVKKEYLNSKDVKRFQNEGVITAAGKVSKRYFIDKNTFTDQLYMYTLNKETKDFDESKVIFRWEKDEGQSMHSENFIYGAVAYAPNEEYYQITLPEKDDYNVYGKMYNEVNMDLVIFSFNPLSASTLNKILNEELEKRISKFNEEIDYFTEQVNWYKKEIEQYESNKNYVLSFRK